MVQAIYFIQAEVIGCHGRWGQLMMDLMEVEVG
jgi:hypothetical protein